MGRLIHTYAIIKSLYDQGKDYIDFFLPFAIKVFPKSKSINLNYIHMNLERTSDLKIPLHVLGTILQRAIERGYINKEFDEYTITPEGFKYMEKLEPYREVRRRINSLLDDMKHFFDENDVSLGWFDVEHLLLAFIHKNIDPLIEFINPSAPSNELTIPELREQEETLIKYIKIAEQRKPEHYRTLQDMILGSIISTVLYAEKPSEILGPREGFRQFKVFLDTNFVFSLLNLHDVEENESARELFSLLESYEFDIRVFSFTVDEICRVVNGYLTQAHRYPSSIRVDSIYGSFRRNGWSRSDARDFVRNIEEILHSAGIEIDWTDINLKTYDPKEKNIRFQMMEYKLWQDVFHQNHDIAAIERIRDLRGKPARKIVDAKMLFLTSDIKLSKMNFVTMGHRENGTICEVILDRLLANILWLNNPNVKPPLKSIIAAHSRDIMVEARIWNRFFEIVYQLKMEGTIKSEDIVMLLFQNYIEDVLKEFEETEVRQITPEFVLSEIEKASKMQESRLKEEIEKKEREYQEHFKEEILKKEQEKDAEWLKKIDMIKEGLEEAAENSARKYTLLLKTSLTILLTTPLILCAYTGKWSAFQYVVSIICVSSTVAGMMMFRIERIWNRVEHYLKKKFYNKKKKESNINNI